MHAHRVLCMAGLLLCAGSAQAQAIYKCVEPGKPVSFQTTPCPAAATVAGVRGFTPDRELTAEEKRQREAQWATRPRARTQGTATAMPSQPPTAVDRCAIAKTERDQWERNSGLNRTHDGLRAWNDHVARMCR